MATFDVVLKGGRVLDPAQGIDATLDIGTKHGRITALESDLPADEAWLVLDATDHFVTPGLIDLHAHLYWGGTDLGVLPDPMCLTTGVTTAADAGSAGWANFTGLRHFILGQARTRAFAFVNISSIGITDMRVGENLNLAYCGVEDAIKTIEANRDIALGVKVRVAKPICGPNGIEPLRRAAAVRDATGTRMMVHISDSEQAMSEILPLLNPGDIITHCFTGRGRLILDQQKRTVLPEVRAAQENGIGFDVGHGQGSFSFEVARDALADGFLPDTISTDLHNYSAHSTALSLPDVMSKFSTSDGTYPTWWRARHGTRRPPSTWRTLWDTCASAALPISRRCASWRDRIPCWMPRATHTPAINTWRQPTRYAPARCTTRRAGPCVAGMGRVRKRNSAGTGLLH